jgi:putative DeoR family transcriptional regulator (stage III sporulation protein D)
MGKKHFYLSPAYNVTNARGGKAMQEYIQKRVLEICTYILETQATVRQAAQVFGVSKSTVHKDMTERLPSLNKELAQQVKKVLDYNKAERHLRGGEATRNKYRRQEQ